MYTTEQLVQRFEDQRYLKNLMGKYANCIILNKEEEIFDRFWSQKEDICLGFNQGWYQGQKDVENYYLKAAERNALVAALMQKKFPEHLGGQTPEEIHGVGSLKVQPMYCPVIEIADDRETAKGLCYSMGTHADVEEAGPVARWIWGVFRRGFCVRK